jgi:hypothetical protein
VLKTKIIDYTGFRDFNGRTRSGVLNLILFQNHKSSCVAVYYKRAGIFGIMRRSRMLSQYGRSAVSHETSNHRLLITAREAGTPMPVCFAKVMVKASLAGTSEVLRWV